MSSPVAASRSGGDEALNRVYQEWNARPADEVRRIATAAWIDSRSNGAEATDDLFSEGGLDWFLAHSGDMCAPFHALE